MTESTSAPSTPARCRACLMAWAPRSTAVREACCDSSRVNGVRAPPTITASWAAGAAERAEDVVVMDVLLWVRRDVSWCGVDDIQPRSAGPGASEGPDHRDHGGEHGDRDDRHDEGDHEDVLVGLAVGHAADDQQRHHGTGVGQGVQAAGSHGGQTVHGLQAHPLVQGQRLEIVTEGVQGDGHATRG
ncbi:hypothetical protein ACFFX0_24215 [Citricoccus parietis]|uniref:Uncharacterized protein n=1 Tax=Citricoccus parietis TaxID=592307 RepID=A0ABV5G5B0_9MICC